MGGARHVHEFSEDAHGTTMVDRIEYLTADPRADAPS